VQVTACGLALSAQTEPLPCRDVLLQVPSVGSTLPPRNMSWTKPLPDGSTYPIIASLPTMVPLGDQPCAHHPEPELRKHTIAICNVVGVAE